MLVCTARRGFVEYDGFSDAKFLLKKYPTSTAAEVRMTISSTDFSSPEDRGKKTLSAIYAICIAKKTSNHISLPFIAPICRFAKHLIFVCMFHNMKEAFILSNQ